MGKPSIFRDQIRKLYERYGGGKYADDLLAARDEARVEWEDTVDGLLRANTQLLSACEAVLKDTGSNKLHPQTRRELFAAIRETRGAL